MRRVALGLAGLFFTIACGEMANSTQQIAAVSVKLELVAIAKAEARYQVEQSTYGTIEQLQKADLLKGDPDRKGYTFKLEVNGSEGFSVTASPADEKDKAWPTYTIDQNQQITEK
jgi:hypothetical protein